MTTEPTKNLQTYANNALTEHNIPAISLAIWQNNQLQQAAAGCLNLNTGVEATTDSIFQIGSITKVMTTSLLMQLVDEGLVELDAPVKHYLRDFMIADAEATASITVRQLVNDTNGIAGDYFPDDVGHEGNLLARYIDRCSLLPLVHPPGQMFSYSNSAFAVAGRLIEVVRGISWSQAMGEYLFAPLGMAHAIADPAEMIRYRCAMGHIYDGDNTDRWVLPEQAYLSMGMAPVGSTPAMSAENLVRFGRAHMEAGKSQQGKSWLSPEAVVQMQSAQIAHPVIIPGLQKFAGLGWGLNEFQREGQSSLWVAGHGGGTNGFLSMLNIVPEYNACFAILINGYRPSAIEGLTNDCLKAITDISIKQPEPNTTQTLGQLSKVCGVYESFDTHITVTATADKLLATIVYKIDPLPPLALELRHIEEGVDQGVFAAYATDGRRCPSVVFMDYNAEGVPQYLFNGGRQNPRIA